MHAHTVTTTIGKAVKAAMRLRGGGSALPGLVVEKLDPKFLSRALSNIQHGVVVISGTNGKTTTTKMVVQLLRANGLNVFTNPSGSNFTRGVVASLLDHIDTEGHLVADIAVIELDEAHAVHFVHQVKPRYTLILNVLRDQLDRFGEIDTTAQLLRTVVDATSDGVVLNREDKLVRDLVSNPSSDVNVRYFGLSESLRAQFPGDDELHSASSDKKSVASTVHPDDVILDSVGVNGAVFAFGDTHYPAKKLKLDGMYNTLNAAAALALCRMILPGSDELLLNEIANVRPAFGRGEAVMIGDDPLEIVLVKNPSGFRLALQSYADTPSATMIAINDNYADGRDMSWLWDVSFDSLTPSVSVVSGIRAYDMALRLQYDLIDVTDVIPELPTALDQFISTTNGKRRIYCTYTAMLALRRHLAKSYSVEVIEA